MNIEIKGEEVFIDGQKYVREPKPEEPEIEEGRLVYVCIDGDYEYLTQSVKRYDKDDPIWKSRTPRPVNRRWYELTKEERDVFIHIVRSCTAENIDIVDAGHIFDSAVMTSSGEKY